MEELGRHVTPMLVRDLRTPGVVRALTRQLLLSTRTAAREANRVLAYVPEFGSQAEQDAFLHLDERWSTRLVRAHACASLCDQLKGRHG